MLWCVFKPSSNTLPVSPYREVSPLWPSRGRLKCTSNSSSTWGKPTARSSTSPSRRRPEGNGGPEGEGRPDEPRTSTGGMRGRTDVNGWDGLASESPLTPHRSSDSRSWRSQRGSSATSVTHCFKNPHFLHKADTNCGNDTRIDTHLIYYAVTVGWMCFSNHMTNTFCKLTVF